MIYQDPSSAIPKGTLLAIGVTSASYILFASLAAATVLRAATGNWSDYEHLDVSQYFSVCENRTCEFGLHFNQQVNDGWNVFESSDIKKAIFKGHGIGIGFRTFELRRMLCCDAELGFGLFGVGSESIPSIV